MPVISRLNKSPSASRRKLKFSPSCGNQSQLCKMAAPAKICFASVSNNPKQVKLTAIAPKAVASREKRCSNATRVVPNINGNKIIIGSTLVSMW